MRELPTIRINNKLTFSYIPYNHPEAEWADDAEWIGIQFRPIYLGDATARYGGRHIRATACRAE